MGTCQKQPQLVSEKTIETMVTMNYVLVTNNTSQIMSWHQTT
jgi:hypothetical protein